MHIALYILDIMYWRGFKVVSVLYKCIITVFICTKITLKGRAVVKGLNFSCKESAGSEQSVVFHASLNGQ